MSGPSPYDTSDLPWCGDMPAEIEARGRSLEKIDGYVLKKANVIIERRRMIMKVLVSALFAAAVIIPPALADERKDAYAGVERWSAAFNSGDVEQLVRVHTDDARNSVAVFLLRNSRIKLHLQQWNRLNRATRATRLMNLDSIRRLSRGVEQQ
jgi:hypothetical protein